MGFARGSTHPTSFVSYDQNLRNLSSSSHARGYLSNPLGILPPAGFSVALRQAFAQPRHLRTQLLTNQLVFELNHLIERRAAAYPCQPGPVLFAGIGGGLGREAGEFLGAQFLGGLALFLGDPGAGFLRKLGALLLL